jgi:hypothetical protein
MDRVQWNPGAPTWEQLQAAGERLKAAQEEHENIRRYKERADYYRDRMAGGDVTAGQPVPVARAAEV